MPNKQAINKGRNPKRPAESFEDQEPLFKRTRSKRDASSEKFIHNWASFQKTSLLSTFKPEAIVNKENNRPPSKQFRRSPKRNEGAVSVQENCRDSVGLKEVSNLVIMFKKGCVLGKRSKPCRDSRVEEDNKPEDTLCFDAFIPVKEEEYKHQRDFYGLPLKKFKKMSLESVEVTELPQDKEVGLSFIVLCYRS